jgi:ABC-2 type transport system ATP-binding protein
MNSSSSASAIQVSDLSKRFKEVRALDQICFEVMSGEIFGLLGPNGAGKTTTIRLLVGLLTPDAGQATVFGFNVVRQSMEVRRLSGYVPQQLSADGSLTGRENVELFARLYDVPRRLRERTVSNALEVMGVSEARNRLVSTYSGGMVRRLELAQALVNRPRLLVLDEPTIGLDPIARGDVWERVQNLRKEAGTTILLTTHYMEEADQLCDRVALMHQGRIATVGAPAELKSAEGPNSTLEDVFRHYAGNGILDEGGGLRNVRAVRRTIGRVG